jgi:glucose-1-phosphate thymidylyltransferase
VERFEKQPQGGRILLSKESDPSHLQHLGVPAFDAQGRLTGIVEKPENPPSPYAVTGIYFYEASVFDILPGLQPSGRGELEITDVNNALIERGALEWEVLDGFWGDAGESIDAYYAVNDFVRKHGANRLP